LSRVRNERTCDLGDGDSFGAGGVPVVNVEADKRHGLHAVK